MKKASILIAMFAVVAATSAAKADEVSRGLPEFTLPSVQFEELEVGISNNSLPGDLPCPVAVSKRTFRDNYDFLTTNRGGDFFSPVSDLNKLKGIIKSLPVYLNRANLDFESQRRILEIVSNGEHNIDVMLLKYSNTGRQATRADFLAEAGPAMNSLQSAFMVLKGNQNGGSSGDNCWSNCVQDCQPTDLGGIVCHLSCYYTCETLR